MYHNYRWYHNYSVTYNVFDHTEIQSMCVIYCTRVDPLFRACRKSELRIRSACPAASYARVSQQCDHLKKVKYTVHFRSTVHYRVQGFISKTINYSLSFYAHYIVATHFVVIPTIPLYQIQMHTITQKACWLVACDSKMRAYCNK